MRPTLRTIAALAYAAATVTTGFFASEMLQASWESAGGKSALQFAVGALNTLAMFINAVGFYRSLPQ